jgi:hypothetical protein
MIRTSGPFRRGDGYEPNSAKTLGLNNPRFLLACGAIFLDPRN